MNNNKNYNVFTGELNKKQFNNMRYS